MVERKIIILLYSYCNKKRVFISSTKQISFLFIALTLAFSYSCESTKNSEDKTKPKSEYEKIKDAFVGKFHEDDQETDVGVKIKNIKGEH